MEEQQKMQNFEEVIRSLKELNDEEKEQLIQMEKELDPTWKEIEALEDKVSAIYEKVFRGYDEDKLSKEELEMLNKKAEEEAKDLNAKLDVLYGIIEKAHEKNEAIAPYAAPKRFIVVDALPRNDAGKILRRQLRENLRNEKSEES